MIDGDADGAGIREVFSYGEGGMVRCMGWYVRQGMRGKLLGATGYEM